MRKDKFLDIIGKNPINNTILQRLPSLDIPDAWLVAGSLFQTVWNDITKRSLDHGIRDYDLFYFDDSDLSWEAEDKVINDVKSLFSDLDANIEIRNQARVHLWYPEKFNIKYTALSKTTDGIDRFLAKACQVGIHVNKGKERVVYCPSGYDDLFNMIIRPNQCDNFKLGPYLEKASRWKELWPELTILDGASTHNSCQSI